MRLAALLSVVAALAAYAVGCSLHRDAKPCPQPPAPTECCQSCTPEDIGCGVLVCKPGSGVNCGPCPSFGGFVRQPSGYYVDLLMPPRL